MFPEPFISIQEAVWVEFLWLLEDFRVMQDRAQEREDLGALWGHNDNCKSFATSDYLVLSMEYKSGVPGTPVYKIQQRVQCLLWVFTYITSSGTGTCSTHTCMLSLSLFLSLSP
jgi:hypothetical protein